MFEFLQRFWQRLVRIFDARLSPEQAARLVQLAVDSLLILLAATLFIWLAHRLLRRLERRMERVRGIVYRRRVETITSLFGSSISYAVWIGAGMSILSLWGIVDVQSLAFGSAAIGAAIGFGSQGLVQDVITGLSILAEDQLAVGDYVEIGGKAGVVEAIGMRAIKLRDYQGVQHVVFNRNISLVSNFSERAVQAVVDVSLESLEAGKLAETVARRVCHDLATEVAYFPVEPVVEGVLQSSTKDIFLRLRVHVLPQQDAAIKSIFMDRLVRAFKAEELVIPDDRIRVVIVSDLFKKAIARAAAE